MHGVGSSELFYASLLLSFLRLLLLQSIEDLLTAFVIPRPNRHVAYALLLHQFLVELLTSSLPKSLEKFVFPKEFRVVLEALQAFISEVNRCRLIIVLVFDCVDSES